MGSRSTCFDCLSSDGLAVYADGTYCFSCHIKTTDHKLVSIPKSSTAGELENTVFFNEEGEIIANILPHKACVWLLQYGITQKHLQDFNIFWSGSYNRLVFPYYTPDEDGKISAPDFAWMRDLDGRTPKWLRYGEVSGLYHIHVSTAELGNSVVLVEDVVSGIRITDYMSVLVLGSTNASDELLVNKLKDYENVFIWLDGDEPGKRGAEDIRNRFKLTKNITIIRTPKDPKEYDVIEMGRILSDRIKSTQSIE